MLSVIQLGLGFFVLVAFLYMGVWVNAALNLPIPGPLSGLILLFLGLLTLGKVPKALQTVAHFLLRHMSLFFIPVTIYIIVLKDKFQENLILLLSVLVFSTFISMLLAAIVSKHTLKHGRAD